MFRTDARVTNGSWLILQTSVLIKESKNIWLEDALTSLIEGSEYSARISWLCKYNLVSAAAAAATPPLLHRFACESAGLKSDHSFVDHETTCLSIDKFTDRLLLETVLSLPIASESFANFRAGYMADESCWIDSWFFSWQSSMGLISILWRVSLSKIIKRYQVGSNQWFMQCLFMLCGEGTLRLTKLLLMQYTSIDQVL